MIEKIYKKLPVFIQHLLLTIKNSHVLYQKYNVIPFIRPLESLIKNLKKEPILLNDERVYTRINKLVAEAIKETVYYQVKCDQYQFSNFEEFYELPILNKKDIQRNAPDFISSKSHFFNSYHFKTSGSTGTPLEGEASLNDLRKRFFVFLQSLLNNGIDYSLPLARFSGSEVADSENIYRKDFINNHYFFSIYDLKEENIFKYHRGLEKNNIKILEGYPSTLYKLAKLSLSKNLNYNSVKHVLTTAEKLHDYQRETIEKVFNCSVFDFYGSMEGSSYIYECPYGKYHNSNKISFLEILDHNDEPVNAGEEGRMIVTSFTTHFTPLIRYDIGDNCRLSKQQNCICGAGGIVIDEIIGRDDENFITPDGKHFSRFSLCLKYLPKNVTVSQLHLRHHSYNVKVLYQTIKQNKISEPLFKSFEHKFQRMLGTGYNFQYEMTDKLQTNRNGKIRAVVIHED